MDDPHPATRVPSPRTTPPLPRALVAAAIAATLAGAPASALAQGSTSVSASCAGSGYAPIVQQPNTPSTSVNCSVGTATMSGSASAVNGVVRATSTTTLAGDTKGVYALIMSSQWSDMLSLGLNSGVWEVEFGFRVNGALSRGYIFGLASGIETSGYAEATAAFSQGSGTIVNERYALSPFNSGPASKSDGGDYTFKLRVDAWGNIDFRYGLTALSVVRNEGDVTYSGPTFGSADFGNSAGITGLRFFDTSGSLITAPVQYTFQNGTQFYNPSAVVSPVPEPGTWALLGTGLLAIGGVAARRRRTIA